MRLRGIRRLFQRRLRRHFELGVSDTLIKEVRAELASRNAPANTLKSVTVEMDFTAMSSMYEQYGWDGAYAYLVETGIAKDLTHGKFLIDKIFLPQYQAEKKLPANTN